MKKQKSFNRVILIIFMIKLMSVPVFAMTIVDVVASTHAYLLYNGDEEQQLLKREQSDAIFYSGFESIDQIPVINMFSATPLVLDSGESSTISWVLENNASSCSKSGDWSGSVVPDNGTYQEVINHISSSSVYSLQCFNEFGSSQVISVDVFVNQIDTAPIVELSADPVVIKEGGSSTVHWVIANDALNCVKSGDWSGLLSGNDISNGLHSEVINNITSDSIFNLTCSNTFGDSSQASVAVTVIPAPLICAIDQPPVLNGEEDWTIKLLPGAFHGQVGSPINPATYDGTYEDIVGSNWPSATSSFSFATLSKNKYIAMEFITNQTTEIGQLRFVAPGNAQGPVPSAVSVAISECPGDFNTHLNQDKCRIIGDSAHTLRWSQNPDTSRFTHCKLDQNTRYYLNIVHSNSEDTDFSVSSCDHDFCGIIFNQSQ